MLTGRTFEPVGTSLDCPAEKRLKVTQQVARLTGCRRLLGFAVALLALPVGSQRCRRALVANALDQRQYVVARNRGNGPIAPEVDKYLLKVPLNLPRLALVGHLWMGSDDLQAQIVVGHCRECIRLEP